MRGSRAAPAEIHRAVVSIAALAIGLVLASPVARAATLPGASGDTPGARAGSAPIAVPSDEALALIRSEVGHGGFRLWVGRDGYGFRRARFDGDGVTFEPSDQWGLAKWSGGDKVPPPPLPSPIAWSRISRIEIRRSAVLAGVVLGTMASVVAFFQMNDPIASSDLVLATIAAGPVAGGIAGAAWGRRRTVWDNPEAGRP